MRGGPTKKAMILRGESSVPGQTQASIIATVMRVMMPTHARMANWYTASRHFARRGA